MKRPCYGCLNRRVGCHSICDAYLEFEAKNKKLRNDRFARTSALTNPVLREAGTEKLRKRAGH